MDNVYVTFYCLYTFRFPLLIRLVNVHWWNIRPPFNMLHCRLYWGTMLAATNVSPCGFLALQM